MIDDHCEKTRGDSEMGNGSNRCQDHAKERDVHPKSREREKDRDDGKTGRDPRKKDEEN
jgi:hypothetical protein